MSIPAAQIFFAPRVPTDWTNRDSGDVDDALDQVAKRLTWTVTGIKTGSYTANDREIVRVDPTDAGFEFEI